MASRPTAHDQACPGLATGDNRLTAACQSCALARPDVVLASNCSPGGVNSACYKDQFDFDNEWGRHQPVAVTVAPTPLAVVHSIAQPSAQSHELH